MSLMGDLYGVDPARLLMGDWAIHVPMNLIVQHLEDPSRVAGVFQSQHGERHPFTQWAREGEPHTLLLGDMVFRPRVVACSRHLIGAGLTGLARSGFDPAPWIREGRVVLK